MVPIISLPNAMRTVKTLALLTAPDLDLVTGFLKCFPCVEKLYIGVRFSSFLNFNIHLLVCCTKLWCTQKSCWNSIYGVLLSFTLPVSVIYSDTYEE
jgi:hypothetical protein